MRYICLIFIFGCISFINCSESENEIAPDCSFIEQPTYSLNCNNRPPGTVCLGFSDGYIFLVEDSPSNWSDIDCGNGLTLEIAFGSKEQYHHILNTNKVRTTAIDSSCECESVQ